LSALIWVQLVGAPGFFLSFELGSAVAWATLMACIAIVARAATIGVDVGDIGVVVRNQWWTYRIPWSEVERVESRRVSILQMEFVFVVRGAGRRSVRVWSSYASSCREELVAALRRRSRGKATSLDVERFRSNDGVVAVWRDARRRAALDPRSVGDSRRMFLRHFGARLPLVMGASMLAGRRAAAVTLLVLGVVVALLTVTIRPPRQRVKG
jgi:hypothetical protein